MVRHSSIWKFKAETNANKKSKGARKNKRIAKKNLLNHREEKED